MLLRSIPFVALASSLVVATMGCLVESEAPGTRTQPSAPGTVKPSYPAAPAVAIVDTNKTMNAVGGQGVGVFVEYRAGGDWHVWWTCDTNRSGRRCPFDVTLTSTAALYDVQQDGSATGAIQVVRYPNSTGFSSITAREIHSVDFKTAPGESILLGAKVDGVASPEYFFFVQDGKVNGGYQGTLTNPVYFQPSLP
jgi:hypothetical protein